MDAAVCVCVCALSRLPWLFQLSDSVAVTSRMAIRVQWFLLPALFKPSTPTPLFLHLYLFSFFLLFFFFSRCSLVQGLQATLQGSGLLMATMAGITTLLLPSFPLFSFFSFNPPICTQADTGVVLGCVCVEGGCGALRCCLKSLQAGV